MIIRIKFDHKSCAALRAVFRLQGAVLLRDNHSREGEPDTYAMRGGIFAFIKTLEEVGQIFLVKSSAVVFNYNLRINCIL